LCKICKIDNNKNTKNKLKIKLDKKEPAYYDSKTNAMTENKRNAKPFRELPGGVRQQAVFS
jgi:hypothetical protein